MCCNIDFAFVHIHTHTCFLRMFIKTCKHITILRHALSYGYLMLLLTRLVQNLGGNKEVMIFLTE